MKTIHLRSTQRERASTLLCALSAIAVLSMIGAGVLMNCTTRYNASATQVRGWKEALQAAEAGGEIAFASIRNKISADDATAFSSASGWSAPAPAPAPSSSSWALGYSSPSFSGPTATCGQKSRSTASGRCRAILRSGIIAFARSGLRSWPG